MNYINVIFHRSDVELLLRHHLGIFDLFAQGLLQLTHPPLNSDLQQEEEAATAIEENRIIAKKGELYVAYLVAR